MLPPAFANDRERMARFEREAHLLASLTHASIAAVYGLEQTPSGFALVMELVEGEDLSQRLRRGPIQLDEALRIALPITEALEWAHDHGVVHRDLKPANVKVTPDGRVKVLDFGLAKALDTAQPGVAEADQSPTLSFAATRAGIIMGTAAYMSPEQASGKTVDKRADVWSFGVLLYEILSGHRLFEGETVSHTLADVLRAEVDWSRLPENTPPAIRQLLERCLDRDLRHRLRDIGEARIAIESQLASSASSLSRAASVAPARPLAAPPPSRQVWLPWAVAAVCLALAATAWFVRPRPVTASAPRLRVDARIGGERLWTQVGPAIDLSADGSRMAYITGGESQRQLWVRQLDQLDSIKLSEGNGADNSPYHPFFSPDGAWIGYVTSSELRKVPASGGTPLTLCKVNRSRGASWGADDSIVFTPSPNDVLYRIPAAGGEPKPLTTLDKAKKEMTHRWPQILPGGAAVLFTAHSQAVGNFDNASIQVVTIATGERKVVHSGGTFGRYVPSGHLIFVNKGTVFAAPFDLKRLEVTGTPAPIVQNVTAGSDEGSMQLVFAGSGVMGYIRGGQVVAQYPIVWVDRDGRTARLTDDPGAYSNPRLSPDGRRLALTVWRDTNWDIWVYDLERSVPTRLTFDESPDTEQIWSPDGRELVFSSDRGGTSNLFRKPSDGSGEEKRVTKSDVPLWASSWSPDGIHILATSSRPNLDVGVVTLGGEPEIDWYLTSRFNESDAIFSPDGRWVAYASTESGRSEVYVRPFGPTGGRWQISDTGGAFPRWSRSGRELFFRTNEGIVSVAIDVAGGSLVTGKPNALFKGPFRGGIGGISIAGNTFADYDVSADGKRFVMFPMATGVLEERVGVVTLVTSWFDDLNRATATGSPK